MKNFFIKLIATGLFTGYSPWVSGTVGTVPAWVLLYLFFGDDPLIQPIVTLLVFAVSVWAASEAEKMLGHDSKKIVIDEWAGMCVAVLWMEHTLVAYIIAFVAFRFFDVVKLWPAAQSEKLPRGWGVTMDDIVAGAQANIVTSIIVFLIAKL